MKGKMMNWNKSTPPKDKPFIGICADYPWATIMVWCECESEYVYADVQASGFNGMEDIWFDNERCKEVTAWMPLPDYTEEK